MPTSPTLTRQYGETIDDVLAWGKAAAQRLDDARWAPTTGSSELEPSASPRSTPSATSAAAGPQHGPPHRGQAARGCRSPGSWPTWRWARRPSPSPSTARAVGLGAGTARDDVEILLAANPGSPARTVAKAASGGELSRVMLAIEVVTGQPAARDVPTFVFDEVDAGVGGRAALDVGARLAALARHAQVVVVTHLPQVAAYADRHLVVAQGRRRAHHPQRRARPRGRGAASPSWPA